MTAINKRNGDIVTIIGEFICAETGKMFVGYLMSDSKFVMDSESFYALFILEG